MTNKEYLRDLEKGDLLAVAYNNAFRFGFFSKFGLSRALYFYDAILVNAHGHRPTFKPMPWRVTTAFVGRVIKMDRTQLTDEQIRMVDKAYDYLKTNGHL